MADTQLISFILGAIVGAVIGRLLIKALSAIERNRYDD